MSESLSIPDMHRSYTLKALNTSRCTKEAAKRLGVNERTVYHWKRDFGIEWDPLKGKYVINQDSAQINKNLTHKEAV